MHFEVPSRVSDLGRVRLYLSIVCIRYYPTIYLSDLPKSTLSYFAHPSERRKVEYDDDGPLRREGNPPGANLRKNMKALYLCVGFRGFQWRCTVKARM